MSMGRWGVAPQPGCCPGGGDPGACSKDVDVAIIRDHLSRLAAIGSILQPGHRVARRRGFRPRPACHGPWGMTHRQSAIRHGPSALRHRPSAIRHRPAAIRPPPSAIGHRPSAIGHLPSAICHRPRPDRALCGHGEAVPAQDGCDPRMITMKGSAPCSCGCEGRSID